MSLALALSGVLLLWSVCRTRYGRTAALGGLVVLLVHRAFLADIVTMRTQALSFAAAALCIYAVAHYTRSRQADRWVIVAGFAAGAAVLTRLSFLPLALALPLYVGFTTPANRRLRNILAGAAGAWMVPMLVAVYFFLVAKDKFLFGIYGYHVLTGRGEDALWWLISFLLSSWSNTGFWSILVLAAGIVLLFVQRRQARPRYSFEWFVFGIWIAITLIHLSRHPTHAIYQTPLAWAPMILAAWMLRRLAIWQRYQTRRQTGAVLSPARASGFATAVLILFSVTWIAFQNGPLESKAARRPEFLATFLQTVQPQEGEKLISFEAGISFCSPQLNPVPGYEMSEFSMMPVLPPELQEQMRGVSLAKFKRDLQSADLLVIRSQDLPHLAAGTSETIASLEELLPGWRRVGFEGGYGEYRKDISIWRRGKNDRPNSVYN